MATKNPIGRRDVMGGGGGSNQEKIIIYIWRLTVGKYQRLYSIRQQSKWQTFLTNIMK